LKVVIGVG
jgi:peptidylprolyl isomerase